MNFWPKFELKRRPSERCQTSFQWNSWREKFCLVLRPKGKVCLHISQWITTVESLKKPFISLDPIKSSVNAFVIGHTHLYDDIRSADDANRVVFAFCVMRDRIHQHASIRQELQTQTHTSRSKGQQTCLFSRKGRKQVQDAVIIDEATHTYTHTLPSLNKAERILLSRSFAVIG